MGYDRGENFPFDFEHLVQNRHNEQPEQVNTNKRIANKVLIKYPAHKLYLQS